MQTISAVLDEEAVLAGGGENDLRSGSGRVVGALERSRATAAAASAGSNGNDASFKRTEFGAALNCQSGSGGVG